jgi:deoxycytidylate deaminase
VQKPTIEQLQDEGNRLRLEHGVSALAIACVNRICETEKNNKFDSDTVVLIDGIRNDGEIRALRSFPNFYLMSIHAKKNVREGRLVGRGKKFNNRSDFDKADKRDEKEGVQSGQQVKRCNDMSDIIIHNNKPLQENTDTQKQFFEGLVTDYIGPIKSVRDASPIPDHPPKINELLMTMAYCASKRSSCENRKVGAVIAHVEKFNFLQQRVRRPEDHIKFKVISSGYNEVPLGTDPCTLGEYQKCYRDHAREELARKYLNCPNCGERIPDQIECPSCKAVYERASIECYCTQTRADRSECKTDLLANYKCTKCETKVFSTYLLGSVKGSGKLLDICRALHGEENAIIGLTGVSKPNNGKLVLYTTTYPCNLCANKIVAAGIKLVIYAEPYTMKEAENILRDGDVLIEPFEGVKSSAYFRLYS